MEQMKPEKAVEVLKKHGQDVTVEEAKLILDFMYKFANIAVAQVLRRQEISDNSHRKAS